MGDSIPPSSFPDQALPYLLERQDLFAQTEADPENTAGYAVPLIHRIQQDGPSYGPTALVILPTRELAIQVHEVLFQLSDRGTSARIVGAFEGKPLTSQIGPLKHGADIVIGTPGRILEHVKKKTLRIEQLKVLVLDGLDGMLEQSLGRQVESIIENTPRTRQTILLVSTAPPRVLQAANRYLSDPVLIGIDEEELGEVVPPPSPAETMTNLYIGAGKGAGVTPRDLVGLVSNEGGLPGERIGEIKIKQNFSLVAVPAEQAKGLVSKLRSSLVKGRKAKIRLERF